MRNLSKTDKDSTRARDTGLAAVLILLLAAQFTKNIILILPAIGVLLLTMTWPAAFGPLSRIWFGLSHIMGKVVSTIVLTIIFFLIVTPIGVIRRMTGADSLSLKKWKKGDESVFNTRDHTFSAEDLERPF